MGCPRDEYQSQPYTEFNVNYSKRRRRDDGESNSIGFGSVIPFLHDSTIDQNITGVVNPQTFFTYSHEPGESAGLGPSDFFSVDPVELPNVPRIFDDAPDFNLSDMLDQQCKAQEPSSNRFGFILTVDPAIATSNGLSESQSEVEWLGQGLQSSNEARNFVPTWLLNSDFPYEPTSLQGKQVRRNALCFSR